MNFALLAPTAIDYSSGTKTIEVFKTVYKDISLIEKPLNLLQKTFSKDVRLSSTREIYPIYEALTIVSSEVAKRNLPSISAEWNNVLKSLHNRKIIRIGEGCSNFDTSFASTVAKKSLAELQKTISVGPVDLNNPSKRQEAVDYISRSAFEIHNFCYTRGFVEELMNSKNVRCLAARDDSQAMVGILWGFFDTSEKKNLFHFWELSRDPKMAHMGIANRLIASAKQQQALYPSTQFVTLNVDSVNGRAKGIYEKEQFAPIDAKEKEKDKIFMSQKISKGVSGTLDSTAKQYTSKFVIETIPVYKLLFFELIRRCHLLFRAVWYR